MSCSITWDRRSCRAPHGRRPLTCNGIVISGDGWTAGLEQEMRRTGEPELGRDDGRNRAKLGGKHERNGRRELGGPHHGDAGAKLAIDVTRGRRLRIARLRRILHLEGCRYQAIARRAKDKILGMEMGGRRDELNQQRRNGKPRAEFPPELPRLPFPAAFYAHIPSTGKG